MSPPSSAAAAPRPGASTKGVASAAQLPVGGVLGDDGFGSESQMTAAMEWATSQGAKPVNMSLGSEEPTDRRATPHVAGAADALAQRHPDRTGTQLKDLPISTARTVSVQQVTEQVGGQIDGHAAALGQVTATGTLAFGPFSADSTAPPPRPCPWAKCCGCGFPSSPTRSPDTGRGPCRATAAAVATAITWSIASARTDTATSLSLRQLDHQVPVDAHNTLRAGRTHTIGVHVRAQDGRPPARSDRPCRGPYEDGRTWRTAQVPDRSPNGFLARAAGPARAAACAWGRGLPCAPLAPPLSCSTVFNR